MSQELVQKRVELVLKGLGKDASAYPLPIENKPSKINGSLSNYIDHTLLRPTASASEIIKICAEAKEHNFRAVCVHGSRAKIALNELKGTSISVAVVVGFPLGSATPAAKAAEAAELVKLGVHELDMVINQGLLIEGDYQAVYEDIRAVKAAAGEKVILKVILETAVLSPEQVIDGSVLTVLAGAEFVKTSTGFSTRGAILDDVKLMKAAVGSRAEIKAAGGVRSYQDAVAMIEAGATRIGTSSGVALLKGQPTASY